MTAAIQMDESTLLLRFVVPGSPVPMERAGKAADGHYYTPPRSREYRARVQRHFAYEPIKKESIFDMSPQQWKARAGIEAVKLAERVRIFAMLYFENFRARDCDNCVKAIADALVKGGFLIEDNFKIVAGMYGEGDIDRRNPRAEVQIHRAPPLAEQPKKRRRR